LPLFLENSVRHCTMEMLASDQDYPCM